MFTIPASRAPPGYRGQIKNGATSHLVEIRRGERGLWDGGITPVLPTAVAGAMRDTKASRGYSSGHLEPTGDQGYTRVPAPRLYRIARQHGAVRLHPTVRGLRRPRHGMDVPCLTALARSRRGSTFHIAHLPKED